MCGARGRGVLESESHVLKAAAVQQAGRTLDLTHASAPRCPSIAHVMHDAREHSGWDGTLCGRRWLESTAELRPWRRDELSFASAGYCGRL